MDRTAIIMKTHKWTDDLELFANKILTETLACDTDFRILMHDDHGQLFNKIKSDRIKEITITFTEKDIRSTYNTGFYSMWLSNHWILMWFYKKNHQKYKYIWSFEYDVRISGSSDIIWTCQSNDDFIYVSGNYLNPNHKYNAYYTGTRLTESQKFYGYLQLARYSKKALKYLDKCFVEGENGQDELIIFSLINRAGLTHSKKFLSNLIAGVWTWEAKSSDYNRKIYDNLEKLVNDNHIHILHPIK